MIDKINLAESFKMLYNVIIIRYSKVIKMQLDRIKLNQSSNSLSDFLLLKRHIFNQSVTQTIILSPPLQAYRHQHGSARRGWRTPCRTPSWGCRDTADEGRARALS